MRVAVRVDATANNGVGHLVRQLALAEELVGRGHSVALFGTSDVDWAQRQIAARGLTLTPTVDPDGFVEQALAWGAQVAMIDGYSIPPETGRAAQEAGIGVATMSDGSFGAQQVADLYIDQNLNAERPEGIPVDASFLGGLDYALLRDQILDRRGLATQSGGTVRVLVVFGGTDAYGGAGVLASLVLDAEVPLDLVVVAANADIEEEILGLTPGIGQTIEVLGPVDDLGGLAAECHCVVSAAGTTVWELLCLGLPTGLVCVTANQEFGYLEAAETRVDGLPVCLPIGRLDDLRTQESARLEAVHALRTLISDRDLRDQLAKAGRALVDGNGRQRVADELERLATR